MPCSLASVLRGERLSWASRVFLTPQEAGQVVELLAHARDERDLLGLAGGPQPLVVPPHHRAVPDGDQRGYVQRGRHGRAAAAKVAGAGALAAVVVARPDADQGADL